MSGLSLGLAPGPIDRADVDIAVVTFFVDERPLRGMAGRADWRLCGSVSRLIQRHKLRGEWGEAVLIPSTGGLRSRWVLVLGLGDRGEVDEPRRREIARTAVERALALGVGGSVALPLPPAGESDPGVDLRLDLVAEAMGEVESASREAGQGPLDVHVRLVPAPEEHAALAEALRRRARSPGPGGLRYEPPPETGPPGRPAGPAGAAGSGRRTGAARSGGQPARLPIK